MLIWLLFVVFLTMWGITFVLFERDLTSPAMLLMSGYTICVGVAAVSWLSYPFAFHWQTFFVISFGTILFLLPAYSIKRYVLDKREQELTEISRTIIMFKPWILIVFSASLICVIFFTVYTYTQILRQFNLSVTYTTAVSEWRVFLNSYPQYGVIKELLILNQIKKIFLIIGWLLLYAYARNCAISHSYFRDKGVLFNLFLVLCLIGTEGGRSGLVSFFLGGLGLCVFFNYFYNGARIRISLKLLLKTAGGEYHSRRCLFCTPIPYGARSGEL